MMRTTSMLAALAALSLAACSSADPGGQGGGGAAVNDVDPPGIAGCKRGALEGDFAPLGSMSGPGVEATTGKLAALPKGAVASTTYLALKPGDAVNQRFGGLIAPIMGELGEQPGLLGFQLGLASGCGTARTLSVWSDEASMLKFVMGPAHSAAMAATSEISRGGSVVTSWEPADAAEVRWEVAAQKLAETYGPYY